MTLEEQVADILSTLDLIITDIDKNTEFLKKQREILKESNNE